MTTSKAWLELGPLLTPFEVIRGENRDLGLLRVLRISGSEGTPLNRTYIPPCKAQGTHPKRRGRI